MKLNRRSFFSGSLALGTAVFAGESHAFPGTHVDQDTENLEGDMLNPAYFGQFPHLAIGRLENGVVLARLHTKEEEFMLTLNAYDELREAFTKISLDPANKVLVLTGTATHFIKGVDMQTFGDLHSVAAWPIVAAKGRRFVQSCIDIEIPVIAAVNGPIPVHSEVALLADIVVAERDSWFQDPHMLGGVAPGDGIHAIWMELFGVNRARAHLLLGQKMTAVEAERLGVVMETLRGDEVLQRALAIARDLSQKTDIALRHARQLLTRRFSQIIAEGMAFGWPLEAMSALRSV